MKGQPGLHVASSRLDYATCKMLSQKEGTGREESGEGRRGEKERKMKKQKGKQKQKGIGPTLLREPGLCRGSKRVLHR